MALTDLSAAVADVAGPAIGGLGLLVEDVDVTPAGKRRLVRIHVDRDLADLEPTDVGSVVAPLSLDEVADATRAISDALDAADPFGTTPYVLEISSPGVSRPLTQPRHFRRNVGRLLQLTLAEGGSRTGRLLAATPTEITLDDAPGPVALADITRARVQVEFSHAGEQDADDIDDAAQDADVADDEEN